MDISFARKGIERLYKDTCTVIEYQDVTDPVTHITGKAEVIVHEDVPCKLSHHIAIAANEGVATSTSLSSFLIINPEIVIKPGSKILVNRNGKVTTYKNSGEPVPHFNHQEIMMEIFDTWA